MTVLVLNGPLSPKGVVPKTDCTVMYGVGPARQKKRHHDAQKVVGPGHGRPDRRGSFPRQLPRHVRHLLSQLLSSASFQTIAACVFSSTIIKLRALPFGSAPSHGPRRLPPILPPHPTRTFGPSNLIEP